MTATLATRVTLLLDTAEQLSLQVLVTVLQRNLDEKVGVDTTSVHGGCSL